MQVDLLDIRATDLRVECSGDLAWKTSRYETRYYMAGEEKVARGTHLWVLRREGATWRVVAVTWQDEE
jgi:ketosteroid isomerase-like protein